MHLWRPRRLQDRGERTPRPCSAPRTVPRPLALCLGAASPVPAALWPHRRVVPASLMAQRTGNQPPADTGKTVQMGCRGGVLAPADPVPPDSPLRPLSSPATLPVTVHPCRAAGVASLILPRMATSPPVLQGPAGRRAPSSGIFSQCSPETSGISMDSPHPTSDPTPSQGNAQGPSV